MPEPMKTLPIARTDQNDEIVSVATFAVSVSSPQAANGYYTFTGKAFEIGDYPDKQFSLSASEADAAIAHFQKAPMNYEHTKGLLDGELGMLTSLTRAGRELIGRFSVPAYLKDVCEKKGVPLKVSLEWNRKTKRVAAGAWVLNPRIKGAQLMAAFSHSEEKRHDRGRPPQRKPNMLSKLKEALEAQGVEMTDDLRALFASQREDEVVKEATEFVDELQRDKRIVPAEKKLVAALFAQALRDDDAREEIVSFSLDATDENAAEGSRADLVRQMFSRRPKHTLMEEVLPDNDAAVFALGNGGNGNGPTNTGKPSESRVNQLLAHTETGKAVLKEKGNK